jgi:hypothetical protein
MTTETYTPYVVIIYTKFVGATDTKGSRIIATSNYFGKKSRVTQNYLHEYTGEGNHKAAALRLLLEHLDQDDRANFELIGVSDHPTGTGNAWVFQRKGC